MKRINSNPKIYLIPMIIGFVFMLFFEAFAQNAPITKVPVIHADSGTILTVPVLVSDFNNIGAVSLTLNFDAEVLVYQSYTYNEEFSTFSIQNSIPGTIIAGGFSFLENGVSLPDSSVLFTLTFNYLGGSSGLIWYENGSSCEYSGYIPSYTTLNDSPQSTYYIDGSVSGFPLPGNAGSISGPLDGMVCEGQTGVIYSVTPIADATGYIWELPSGASITSGNNTTEITVSFSTGAVSGNVSVYGTNAYGSGLSSPPFPVIVNSPAAILIQPVSPGIVYAGSGIAIFNVTAIGGGLTYQWQEFSSGWNNVAEAGYYSGSFTDSLVVTNPPLAFNGYQYRCVISGLCEPQVLTDGNATLTVSAFPLPGAAGIITGPTGGMVCAGETDVVFSVFPIPEATGYVWTLPYGSSITDGYNTNQITVSFTNSAINGFVTVYGTNPYGFGPLSPSYPLIVNASPTIIVQPESPDPVYAGSGTAVFNVSASGSGLTYQWQEFQTGWENVSDGGYYSGALTESMVVSNPPFLFNGNKYRCIIGGLCEPQAITDGNAVLTVNVVLLSEQQLIDENKLMQLTVSPNPCKTQATFSYFLAEDCILTLDFINLLGETVRPLSHLSGRQGLNSTTVETNQLKPGIYIVLLRTNSGDWSVKRTVKLVIRP